MKWMDACSLIYYVAISYFTANKIQSSYYLFLVDYDQAGFILHFILQGFSVLVIFILFISVMSFFLFYFYYQ